MIATDAVISVVTSLIKISVFGLAGVVTAQVLAFALLIGAIAIPGAFLAKAFVERMPVHIHTAILDAAVMVGGIGHDHGGAAALIGSDRRMRSRPCGSGSNSGSVCCGRAARCTKSRPGDTSPEFAPSDTAPDC